MIQAGQKLYRIVNTRGNNPYEIEEVTVKSVGRKYFYLENDYLKRQFLIESLKYERKNYPQNNIQLYKSKQVIIDIEESSRLHSNIKLFFSGYGRTALTLEQLRSIDAIISQP